MIYKAIIASPTIFISWFWSSALISIFKHLSPSRTICDVLQSDSVGFGGFLATIRFLQDKIEKQRKLKKFFTMKC